MGFWSAPDCPILQGIPVDDLDGGLDSQSGYRSVFHGEEPIIVEEANGSAQIQQILTHIRSLLEENTETASICLVARTHHLIDTLKEALTQAGIPCHKIEKEESDDTRLSGVRLATMHRVKGLEFDHMILAHMEAAQWEGSGDTRPEDPFLVHVAATRARKSVLVTTAGPPSRMIQTG